MLFHLRTMFIIMLGRMRLLLFSISVMGYVSLSLSVNYDLENKDKKWNSFGFPFNKWESADLSEVVSVVLLNQPYSSFPTKKSFIHKYGKRESTPLI